MILREARPDDIESILALERGLATAPHWPAGAYRASPGRWVLMAERAGELLGFAVGVLAGEDGEVESVAVREAGQGRGVGTALLGALLRILAGHGARTVLLEVRAGSEGARRMYVRTGFEEVGRRRAYYHEPTEDAVLMRWTPSHSADGASQGPATARLEWAPDRPVPLPGRNEGEV